ncbi:transposase, partial [Pseudomonas sp.]|uniref:IS66 family transposase n=1 Tax=Pseudomonas sp. TaxID=306 RepID=UPI00345C8D06
MHLPRATLCEWKLAAAELLAVLLPALKAHILAAPRVHSEDTTMPMQEAGRGSSPPVGLPWRRPARRERLMGRPSAGGPVRIHRVPRG